MADGKRKAKALSAWAWVLAHQQTVKVLAALVVGFVIGRWTA